MSGRRCEFFADENDLSSLLESFREIGDYKYLQLRSGLNKENLVFHDPAEILPFAAVSPDDPEPKTSFLVLEEHEEVFSRDIERTDGSGVLKIAGQDLNPNSITFAFGGNAGDQTLIISNIHTSGDTDLSVEMHKAFRKVVLSHTQKAGAKGKPYRLMLGAVAKLKAGWRLARGKGWQKGTDANISEEEIAKLKD